MIGLGPMPFLTGWPLNGTGPETTVASHSKSGLLTTDSFNQTTALSNRYTLMRTTITTVFIATMVGSMSGCGIPVRGAFPPPAQPSAPINATASLPSGTPLIITPASRVGASQLGGRGVTETVERSFVVAEPVMTADGRTAIPAGTPVEVLVQRKALLRFGREGRLGIVPRSLTTPSGTTVAVTGGPFEFAGERRVAGTVVGGILLGVLAGAGLFFWLRRGGDIVAEPGTRFQVFTQGEMPIR